MKTLSRSFHGSFVQIKLMEPSPVTAIADDRNNGSSKSFMKGMPATQRTKTKPRATSPLDALPLQQVVGLQMQEFIQGIVLREFNESSGAESKGNGGDDFAGMPGKKEPKILGMAESLLEHFPGNLR